MSAQPAWLDLSCGASAEMVLGALVDAGVPFDVVARAAASTGLSAGLQQVPARRAGQATTWVIAGFTGPQPPTVSLDGLVLTDAARPALEAMVPVSPTDVVEVSAVCAGLAWLRAEGQLTEVAAWPTVETPLTRTLVDRWEPMPAEHLGLVGLGAGTTEHSDHPHVVKLVLAT